MLLISSLILSFCQACAENSTESSYIIVNCDDVKVANFISWTRFKEIVASENKITVIKSNTFEGGESLHFIKLDRNEINTLENDAFEGLGNLEFLHLNNNQLKDLRPGIFDPMRKLWVIWLMHNMLTVLEENLFIQNQALVTIFLDGNKIVAIGPNLFNGLKLTTWNFDNNVCVSTPYVQYDTTFKFLEILRESSCYEFYNKLEEFQEDVDSVQEKGERKHYASLFIGIAVVKMILLVLLCVQILYFY